MSFSTWLSQQQGLFSRITGAALRPTSRRKKLAARRGFRPALELLEDRLVPSGVADSLYVGDGGGNYGYSTVKQFNVATGAYEGTFVAPYITSLFGARGLIFDGNHNLLVSNQTNTYYNAIGNIQRYSAFGDPLQPFVSTYSDAFFHSNYHAPYDPRGLCQGPNGSVFVGDLGDLGNLYGNGADRPGKLIQYDANGQWIRDLAPPATDPNAFSNTNGPRGVVIGPDGDLYVAVRTFNGLGGEVMRFDPVSGAFLGDFVQSDSTNDLNRPEGLVFGPDGNLYITSFTSDPSNSSTAVADTDKVLEFNGTTGQYIGKIDLDQVGQSRTFAQAILFGPDDKLFVSINNTGEIREYDAGPGTFTQDSFNPGTYQSFVSAKANGGPISQAWYMTFDYTDPGTLAYKVPNLVLDASSLDLGTTTYGGGPLEGAFTLPNDGQHIDFQVTAPAGFEISTDGLTWASTLTATTGTAIDVQTLPGGSAGHVSGAIHISSNGDDAILILRGTIKPATLTITPTPGQSMVYGGDFPDLTYTADGFVNNDSPDLLSGFLYTGAFDYGTVGTYNYYTWYLSAGPNYQLVLAADAPTFAITPAPLTIKPAANQSMIYGSAVPPLTYSASGFVNFDDPAYTLTGALGTAATASSPVGNYAFTLDGLKAGGNYTISLAAGSPTFAVTPAPLTVTANAQTKTYGSADPTLTYAVSGLQLSDTAGTVLSGSLTRAAGETVAGSPYAISQGTLAADANYAIAFTGSTLTITQAGTTTTVVGSSSQSVFGQAVTFTATVGVVAPGAGTLTGTVTFMDGNIPLGNATLISSGLATFTTTKLPVGTHTITAMYSGDPNSLASTSTVFTQTVLSAQQELGLIINQVTDMVTKGILDSGNGNALIVKLNAAITSLNNGNTIAGDNQMNAFINQTNALLKSGKLDSSDALALITDIDLAIAAALASPI